jgi:SWI/SNF-related matrix-associated actin-dependent regulator of chromatin subfamily A3
VHEPGIDLQLFCKAEISRQPTTYKTLKSSYCSAYVSVIIYGPLDLFEDIGKYFEDHALYLQDPRGCDRNVPYRNPHCLWSEDEVVPLTLDLAQQPVYLEPARNGLGLLADLESNDYEDESEAPPALKTVLYK